MKFTSCGAPAPDTPGVSLGGAAAVGNGSPRSAIRRAIAGFNLSFRMTCSMSPERIAEAHVLPVSCRYLIHFSTCANAVFSTPCAMRELAVACSARSRNTVPAPKMTPAILSDARRMLYRLDHVSRSSRTFSAARVHSYVDSGLVSEAAAQLSFQVP
jgi:hypothetical protein